MSETIKTPITELFKIKYPILLAGMGNVAGPELVAAVSNAGGLGVMGGIGYTPEFLQKRIDEMKELMTDKNLPFGIDLLIPQIGGNARKTNKDYTKGHLDELIDVIIKNKASLFVSAVGVPPKHIVDKLHAAGIPVMNMVGDVKHVKKALEVGVDLICAQGGEAGGHTGDIPFSILIPKVVDECKGYKSPLTGKPISVIAAGGVFDGRGLAASLQYGADGVWVGTRFVMAMESSAGPLHQKTVISAGYHDTVRTVIYTGRPMRVFRTSYIGDWEQNKQQEIVDLTSKGKIPIEVDLRRLLAEKGEIDLKTRIEVTPLLMGQNAGAIKDIKSSKEIIDEMMRDAITALKSSSSRVSKL